MTTAKNILIVGVGGQGIILASEVLAMTAMSAGFDVKQSEVHGMAQRGGSVSSHVRFGPRVHSPTIPKGQVDVLLSFEMLESMRWLEYLAPSAAAIVNTQRIDPMPVASGKAIYPQNIQETLSGNGIRSFFINGEEIALKAGHIKAVNVALLGRLSTLLDFDVESWQDAIRGRVPAKSLDINFRAFNMGREAANSI
ncbi:MAG: indolepyruvate oxidoreductase subunit beta [Calditrichaeota bacterium]|nr:MAG: indolepyruvate oxidoreductase subunit beta [Calditrichota bacterium]